jgi:hypothetical protein
MPPPCVNIIDIPQRFVCIKQAVKFLSTNYAWEDRIGSFFTRQLHSHESSIGDNIPRSAKQSIPALNLELFVGY